MIIDNLVCRPDGTQTIEQREVSDDFFTPSTPLPTAEEQLRADVDYLAMVTGATL